MSLPASACLREEPVLSPTQRSSAATPEKIRRLLIWLPKDAGQLKSAEITQVFHARQPLLGIEIKVETAEALELDRREAQRQVIADFKPTHRLEIDRGVLGPRRDPTMGVPGLPGIVVGSIMQSKVSGTKFNVALYTADGREPLRAYNYGPAYKASELVDSVIAELKDGGFL